MTTIYTKTETDARNIQLGGGTMTAGANVTTTGNMRAGLLVTGDATYQLSTNINNSIFYSNNTPRSKLNGITVLGCPIGTKECCEYSIQTVIGKVERDLNQL
jgi:hypothetical protein